MSIHEKYFPVLKYSWFDRVVIRLLQSGPFPKHIAFIMDGNRRYARSRKMKLIHGHTMGAENMIVQLNVCIDIGIQCMTLYAFSIENFNCPKEQVDDLMKLFHDNLLEIKDLSGFNTRQICVRFYGNVELFPVDIQKMLALIVLETANNNKFYLNICAPYTAREEMVSAIKHLQLCAKSELINPSNIDHCTFSNALYSCELLEPDILVRTSGVHRLSDFLLWQSAFSHVSFVDEQLPEYSRYSLFKAILRYQIEYGSIMHLRNVHKQKVLKSEYEDFLQLPENNGCTLDKFMAFKDQQIELIQNYIRQKRFDYFVNIANQ